MHALAEAATCKGTRHCIISRSGMNCFFGYVGKVLSNRVFVTQSSRSYSAIAMQGFMIINPPEPEVTSYCGTYHLTSDHCWSHLGSLGMEYPFFSIFKRACCSTSPTYTQEDQNISHATASISILTTVLSSTCTV